jgi:hypothetical protein
MLISSARTPCPGRQVPVAGIQVLGAPYHRCRPRAVLTVGLRSTIPTRRSAARRTGTAWSSSRYAKLRLPQDSPDTRVAAKAGRRLAAAGRPQGRRRPRARLRLGARQRRQQSAAAAGLAAVPRTDDARNGRNRRGARPITRSAPTSTCARCQGKERSGRDHRPERATSAAVALGIGQSHYVPVPVAGLLRYPPRQRPGRTGRGQSGPPGVGFHTMVPGHAESVEEYRSSLQSRVSGSTSTQNNTRDDNAELWWWVLALLAVLAVAESVLGNRHMTAGN